jgi:hypothetical protein
MIASGRSPRLNAAHRRRSRSSGEDSARPMVRSPCQITHCTIPLHLNDGPAALLYRNLTTGTLSDGRITLTTSGRAPISNSHR